MSVSCYPKLRGRIYEKYGTMTAFAEALGIHRQSLSLKMTKKVGISNAEIIRWCELLDIQQEEIGAYFFD